MKHLAATIIQRKYRATKKSNMVHEYLLFGKIKLT